MPRPRLKPTPAPPRPSLGVFLPWPEVDLLISALHDASELHAALWVAAGQDGPLDLASRYALLAARLGLARDAARPARLAAIAAKLGRDPS